MKDPAFLFYSDKYYTGTRLMTPQERACYIDLLAYQHQNGYIPLELDRILLWCTGIDKATLIATLEAKFIGSDKGYYNERLFEVMNERSNFKSKMSISGKIGQFWKKSKSLLSAKEYKELRNILKEKKQDYYTDLFEDIDIKDSKIFKGWLIALLKHYINIDTNISKDINTNKDVYFKEKKLNEIYLDYLQMRKEKKATAPKTTIEAQIKKINKWVQKHSIDQVIEIINKSIENGWTGLFENKINNKSSSSTSTDQAMEDALKQEWQIKKL